MWKHLDSHENGSFQHSDAMSVQPGIASNGYIPFQFIADEFEQFRGGEFSLETGLYNNNTLATESPGQYTPPSAQSRGSTPRPNLSARATDLKAKLIENQKFAKSATPPAAGLRSNSTQAKEGTSSLRESPNTPNSPASVEVPLNRSDGRPATTVTEDDLDALFTEVQSAADAKVKKKYSSYVKSEPEAEQHSNTPRPDSPIQKSTNLPFGKGGENGFGSGESLSTRKSAKRMSNSLEVADYGELLEDGASKNIPTPTTAARPSQPTDARETRPNAPSRHSEEQVLRRRHDDEESKVSQRTEGRARSPQRRSRSPPSRPRDTFRPRDERYADADERFEKKSPESYKPSYRLERKPEPEDRSYQRRDSREMPEDRRKHKVVYEKNPEDTVPQKAKPPTLEDLLEIDEDLRDWLQLTDYHNVEKRVKTLNRRRALAALDAQRAKLLEEEEMETGAASKSVSLAPAATGMAPPFIPIKSTAPVVAAQAPVTAPSAPAPAPTASPTNKIQDKPKRHRGDRSPVLSPQDTGSKRSYSEYRDSWETRDEGRSEREGRLEIRDGSRSERDGRVDERRRVKTERDDDHRPYPRGRESSDHRSASPPAKSYQSDERETYVEGRGQGSGRGHDRGCDLSPGLQAFKSRPPARAFSGGSHEHQEELTGRDRPFVAVGRYRGKAYDPNFSMNRGRGRGTGNWTEPHQKPEPRPPQHSQSGFGSRIASLNSYKDPRGVNKGGRGDTRYFIVKSFNEENVVRCISDSIWTTQVHNGEIFKRAFETCKNVVLIYSINQSHAFQGYARMENVPGSEKAPSWQNNINWESAGAFKVRWITIAVTKFSRVGHLKNSLNENMAVLVAKDGQEVEERCGSELLRLIDEEYDALSMARRYKDPNLQSWSR